MALVSAALLSACGDSPEQMLASAKGYLSNNDTNAAVIQLKNALQENGSLAEARFLLGRINLQQGDSAGAIKELQHALDLGYARAEVAPLLARARIGAGEFDRVLTDFADVKLDDDTAQARLLAAVGDAHFGKANVQEAIRVYQQALALRATDLEAGIGLARARLFSNDPAGAEQAIRAVVAHNSENGDALATLSDILQAQGKQEEALKALEEAVRLSPNQVGYRYTLVSLLFRSGRYEEGVKHFEAMKKVAPNHPSTRYLQAFIDAREGRLTEARDLLVQVLNQAPNFMPAQLLAGSVLLQLNDQAQARNHLNAVLSRAPDQQLARTLLITSHLSSGEASRALELLQPLLETQPTDARILGLAGQVFLANGNLARAEDFLERAAKAAPEDPQARLRLGAARLASGDAEGALADFESASTMDGSAIQADLALVATHLRSGDTEKALKAQAELERKQPQNPLVYNLRGGVMLARQDIPAARAAFEKALSINADFLAAALNLARLDIAEKKTEDALARIRAIADRNDKNVEARLALAELQASTGATPADVLATLERAEAAAPGTLVPGLALIQHHLRNREFPKALAAAQKLSAANPNDPRVVDALARAQLSANETQQGIASLNRLAALRPQSAAPLIQLADVHRRAKNNDAAEQALRKALAVQPDSIDAQQRFAGLSLERGSRGDALKIAKDVQKQHPASPAGYVLEAEIESGAKRWAEAASAYRQAIERSNSGEIVVRLHEVLTRGDRKGEADKLAVSWLREHSQDLVVRGYLAERALAEKRYAEALDTFETMRGIAPDNPLVLNNLAWVASQLKNPKALEYAERAQSLAPDNASILDTLGVIQIEQGQTDKGLANVQRAVSLAPDYLELRLSLARSYAKLGRKDEARKELDTLMPKLEENTPLHSEAAEFRNSL
ncbi:MAG: PEP-CTERM system TPR-repeat protein PrsT [Thauera sp.]